MKESGEVEEEHQSSSLSLLRPTKEEYGESFERQGNSNPTLSPRSLVSSTQFVSSIEATTGAVVRQFSPLYMEGKVPCPSPRRRRTGLRSRLFLKDRSVEDEDDSFSGNVAIQNDSDSSTSSLSPYLSILLPLLLVYISNQWSRSSIYYLVNFSSDATSLSAMNVDIGFSEAQYGALASIAFTALFAVASLFAGNLADQSDRKFVTVTSSLVWSVSTIATCLSTSYAQVLISRVIMGLSCAFATPAAYTLIRDLFPRRNAALASSLYGSGVYFGGALASLSILLDERYGWRVALGVVAVYGIASSLLGFFILPSDPKYFDDKSNNIVLEETVEEVTNEEGIDDGSFTLFRDAASVLLNPAIQTLFLASFTRFCSGLCIGVWAAPYYRLAFPDDSPSYAVVNAFIVSACGVASGVAGGYLADMAAVKAKDIAEEKQAKADVYGVVRDDFPLNFRWTENGGRLLVPTIGSLLAAPAFYLSLHSPSFGVAMTWLGIEYLVAECWFGPTVAVLQSTVQKKEGGTAQGLFTLMGAFGNLAPAALGFWYGQSSAEVKVADMGGVGLAELLSAVVCVGYLLSAVGFAVTAAKIGNDAVVAAGASGED